jgi:hypothetical protein
MKILTVLQDVKNKWGFAGLQYLEGQEVSDYIKQNPADYNI